MAETEKNTNASPPIGKRHELTIGIQQPQRVSLAPWVLRLRNTVTGWVDTVTRRVRPPGRPPEHDYGAMDHVAQELLLIGVDDYLDRFIERIRNECKARGIKVPERGQMRKHFKPMWDAARAQIAKN
jgi:hypothetical protein